MAKGRTPECVNISNKILQDFLNVKRNPLTTQDNVAWSFDSGLARNVTFDDKGNGYKLLEFPIKKELDVISLKYPLYITFNLKIKANDEIDELNIKIFKEDVTQSRVEATIITELLLRVEWSNNFDENNVNERHAQPHWHVHSYKIIDVIKDLPLTEQKSIVDLVNESRATSSIMSAMEVSQSEKEIADGANQNSTPKEDIKTIPYYKFHLSMLCDWDKPNDSHICIPLDNVRLKSWLPKCLFYVKNQFEYIFERMPAN